MARKVKGFSYDPVKDDDVINHLNKQPNYSKYIRDLIRKDINELDEIDIKIKKYIEKYLDNIDFSKDIQSKTVDKVEVCKDEISKILNFKE